MKPVPFRHFGVMIDCSRNAVMRVDALKQYVDILAKLGYNTLMLYTEDTYEVDHQPYFGYLRGRYSQEELRDLDAYAAKKGVELMPCIQTLAHLNAIFRWPPYGPIRDCNDILLPEDDRTYALIEDMFASLAKTFRSRRINIGMDEAHMLGRGQYMDQHGSCDRSEILVRHLARVAEIAAKYGLELIMWGDMFFRMISGGNYYVDNLQVSDEIRRKIPKNVHLIYWDYYSTDQNRYDRQIKTHNAIKEGTWFAGGLWTWTGFAPHNGYSMEATAAALSACADNGVQDVFFTMWGDNGGECTPFMMLPSLYFAAAHARGERDMETVKAGFAEAFGMPFDTFMLLDLPGTSNAIPGQHYNLEKYQLYNDCFMGIMDHNVQAGDAAAFAACAEQLAAPAKTEPYGFLFDSLRALCEALAVKSDLGQKTRAAYAAKDTAALTELLAVYDTCAQKVEAFYQVYRKQWMRINKPHGFEVQDVRLGGLVCRIRHCRDRLAAYLDGSLCRIEELEEPLLPSTAGASEPCPVGFNWWSGIVTANPL